MKKYLTEFIGTFFLVLTVGMTVIDPGGAGNLAPLAIGTALMIMVYAGGHVSGGHYNPAVTLAVWLRGRLPASDVGPYWGSQIAGSVAAAAITLLFKGGHPNVSPITTDLLPTFIAEFIGTFALTYVVLNVATAKNTAGNSYYGLAIGFTVMAMAFALGPVCGGAFNPAVATGITLLHIIKVGHFWVYPLGAFAGGVMAAGVFKFINPEDK